MKKIIRTKKTMRKRMMNKGTKIYKFNSKDRKLPMRCLIKL